MNEKIREYAKQSNLELYGLGKDRAKWEASVDKFAELIVNECAKDFDKTYIAGGDTMGNFIRSKFGVES